MNFNQTTRFIIYLLAKPGHALKGIYFFDISCSPAIASFDIVEIAPTPIGQILPGTKLPLVLPTLSLFSSWCFHNIGLKVIIKAQHALPLQTSDLGLRSDDGNVKSGSHHSPQGRSTLRPLPGDHEGLPYIYRPPAFSGAQRRCAPTVCQLDAATLRVFSPHRPRAGTRPAPTVTRHPRGRSVAAPLPGPHLDVTAEWRMTFRAYLKSRRGFGRRCDGSEPDTI